MKNTYFTGYFPLIAIILFSLSFAVYSEMKSITLLKQIGIYEGMREFFSEAGLKFTLLVVFLLVFFMVFAALKLISDTILELSLLFFSKDSEGESLRNIRKSSVIYFTGGIASLLSSSWLPGIILIFMVSTLLAFIYMVYQTSPALTTAGLAGMIFFHTLVWSSLLFIVSFSLLKLYNSIMASLPL
ncbi:small-conductance mechanosensitive channel [Peribacillus deserti]|uniref:Small-conductance mechanosensitive channel n=1 Tax=Peribacillus deserti TaxID=673318 RepID=A0ABS2QML8_9BACI|nr:DUF5366 family protein [Peribacillus deserti]MBM7694416.1 small-conductance mechanosensitive channel [Peribacillus deserti]